MNNLVYISPTKRTKMTRARAAKIFLARNGICWRCRLQIRGKQWTVEHPECLALGGSDQDGDLWPVHVRCGVEKTKTDVALIAKRNKAVTAGWAGKPKARGFQKPAGMRFDWRRHKYVKIDQEAQ